MSLRVLDRDLTDDDPGVVGFFRPAELPGVEVLVAERSARRWVVLHHTYTVCTMQAIERPAPWRYRGRLFDLGGDCVSFMEPGEVHANLEVTAPATFRVLLIGPEVVEDAAAELGVSRPVHFRVGQVNNASHRELRRAFLALHASLEQAATPLERESLFSRCLQLLLEQCAEVPAPHAASRSDPPVVRRARDFIEAHVTEPVRLQDVVEAAGASSRFGLLRSFGAATGLPPHAYQIQRRIIRARQLLARGLTPAEVAQELGFVDQSHFTRHFTKLVAVPPATYARAIRAH
jgi:AraC-like DNA-binding protein